jgi:hypothetical protein
VVGRGDDPGDHLLPGGRGAQGGGEPGVGLGVGQGGDVAVGEPAGEGGDLLEGDDHVVRAGLGGVGGGVVGWVVMVI